MRTRVKICGITRVEDAREAAALGADAIGLVFYADSPRWVSIDRAQQIVAAVRPFVTCVGLFLDGEPGEVRAVVESVALDVLQFHGDEAPEACRAGGRAYVKAVAMGAATDVTSYAARYPDATGLLLDSHTPGAAGGSGRRFDWDRVPSGLHAPVILAGGLDAANVAEALERVRPYAVDVSSAVESAKGVKDAAKMAAFLSEVQRVDCHRAQA